MNFIKDLFEGKKSEEAHRQFKRFSKGTFENKAVVEIKKIKNKWKIKTSFEFTNGLVLSLAKTIKNKAKVSGAILSTKNLEDIIPIKIDSKKQFMGVKTFNINTDLSSKEIEEINKKIPNALLLFSFSTDEGNLKVKVKSPKSAKSSAKKGKKPKADFCTLETTNREIAKEFFFDINKDFKKLAIKHSFLIEKIIIPEELKKEKDFSTIRERAIKIGTIKREIDLDGEKIKKEKEFEA